MTAKEILEKLLSHTGLSVNSLATEIGLSRAQALYDIQNEKTKSITPSMADRIIQRFSDISRVWLLTGEGDMLGGHDPRTEPTEFPLDKLAKARALADELGVELIPMYSEPFRGGNDGYPLIESMNEVESVWTLPDVRADMIVPVVGDSMAPTFPQGSRLAVSRVWFRPDEPLSIPFGEAFAIVLHDPDDPSECVTTYVKRLYKHEDPAKRREHWIARSDNDRYEDFEVPISHVVGLWRIRASIVYFA
nr:MAG TPA: peptidase [Caudoviricetes sp.]